MTVTLAHFAINADDVPATRAFYEAVFGWTFRPWGPPGFFKIEMHPVSGGVGTGTARPSEPLGALQQRRQLLTDQPTRGLECTFAVDDVDAIATAVRAAGGTILMDRFTISGVGHLIFFEDPGGNPVGAMQYDSTAD